MPMLGSHLRQRAGISVSDFHDALNGLWLQNGTQCSITQTRLAIAVSGGVDSMALAQLCVMLRRYPRAFSEYRYMHAFIVDHKAREGSEIEASLVKRRLCQMGMYSTILSLNWPPQVRPLELPDFETQARHLRYQALGAACRAMNISKLLLAHHADDQAETVLMRLSSGHKSIGVRGMYAFTDIPECWGIHGVHQSCEHETVSAFHDKRSSEPEDTLQLDSLGQRKEGLLSSPCLLEHGGVQVLRPLLKFRKQDLIDTCQAHGVAWSEDATNKDAWRTPRNTIRSLLGSSRLPVALDSTSLTQLSSHMEAREVRHKKYASRLHELCEILFFDLRSGVLVVRLPKTPSTEASIVDAAHAGLLVSRPLTASILVRRLVKLVSPHEDVPLQSLRRAVAAMFPSLSRPEGANFGEVIESSKFTTSGVLFERIRSPLPDIDAKSSSGVVLEEGEPRDQDLDANFVWSLTRQPFANVSADVKLRGSKNAAPTTIVVYETLSCKEDVSTLSLWSPWRLWDGRYWIRIKNLTSQPLKVRPFNKSDLRAIRTSIPTSMRKPLEAVLASVAPDKIRWTLPVIAHAVDEDTRSGKVLALPTLGRTGIIDVEDEKGQRRVEWEVRYKMVDLGRRRNTDIITSWEDS